LVQYICLLGGLVVLAAPLPSSPVYLGHQHEVLPLAVVVAGVQNRG